MRYLLFLSLIVAAVLTTFTVSVAKDERKYLITFTFDSEPTGAEIYIGERSYGTAPVIIPASVDKKRHKTLIVVLKAVWPSGAKNAREIEMDFDPKYTSQRFVVSRPSDAPGIDIDLAHDEQPNEHFKKEEEGSDSNTSSKLADLLLNLLSIGVQGVNEGMKETGYGRINEESGDCQEKRWTIYDVDDTKICHQDRYCNVTCF